MHYYLFNIGDYQSHTGHLTVVEDIAYRRLLDWYYLHESPIPLNVNEVARLIRMRDHLDSINIVLTEFFEKLDTGYISKRADQEISKFHSKIEQASNAGKASAQRRLNARSNPVEPTNNQEPITSNQIEDAKASKSGTTFPTCPHQELIKLYERHLPHLPKPRVWDGSRAASLRQRWVQASKPSSFSENGYSTVPDGLKWWNAFFHYIANDTKLAQGFESQGRTWTPDLPWIINATNFAKIIDGKYNK
mgnify:CR=1 FL=1